MCSAFPTGALKQCSVMNSVCFRCRCSVYTVCTAATSICASATATATPAATVDTSPPVITVRAPARNSINATGYVATTVYVGMPNTHALVRLVVYPMLHPLSAVMLLFHAASQSRCCKISVYMQTLCGMLSAVLASWLFTADLTAHSSTVHIPSTSLLCLFQQLQCHAFEASSFWAALNANAV